MRTKKNNIKIIIVYLLRKISKKNARKKIETKKIRNRTLKKLET